MKSLYFAAALTVALSAGVLAQTKGTPTTKPTPKSADASVSISPEDSAAIWRMKATASDAQSRVEEMQRQAAAAIEKAQQQAQQVGKTVSEKFQQIAAKYGCAVNSFKPSDDPNHPANMTCEKTAKK